MFRRGGGLTSQALKKEATPFPLSLPFGNAIKPSPQGGYRKGYRYLDRPP
jgi:hypothetical protein